MSFRFWLKQSWPFYLLTPFPSLPRNRNFDELLARTEGLWNAQHDRFVGAFDGLGVGGRGWLPYREESQTLTFVVASRPPSFERRRPWDGGRVPPRGEPGGGPPDGGRDPHHDPDMDDRFHRRPRRPPPAPEIPGSPTSSNTTSTHSSNLNSVLNGHWLPEVFRPDLPATPLEDSGQTYVMQATVFTKHILTTVQICIISPAYARL